MEKKKLDWTLSVIILVAYAALWVLYWIMAYQNVSADFLKAISIIRTVALCLMYLVVMYNAVCWTDKFFVKIVFIAIALFLIASAIAVQVPSVYDFFVSHNVPLMM